MRNPKNTRTCKGCFQKVDKTNTKLLQIVNSLNEEDNNKNEIKIMEYSTKTNIQNNGKKLYVCNNNVCISNMLKKKSVQRFFKRNLRDNEIQEIEKYIF